MLNECCQLRKIKAIVGVLTTWVRIRTYLHMLDRYSTEFQLTQLTERQNIFNSRVNRRDKYIIGIATWNIYLELKTKVGRLHRSRCLQVHMFFLFPSCTIYACTYLAGEKIYHDKCKQGFAVLCCFTPAKIFY